MATSDPSPEQRELSLVGKVEMRIALADTDAKLESSLKTYLAPLLLKLASEYQSVRNKVITVCQHINTRVKPESIQLPVAALIKQFKDQQSSLIRHFDLLYIQQGVDRLALSEKSTLLPVVVSRISGSESHGPTIFNLLLRLLETFQLPPRGSKDDVELRTRYEVSNDDAKYLASWLGKFLLFSPQKTTSQSCPGLTPEEYAYFTVQGKPGVWDPSQGGLNLLRTKVLTARLLASGLFSDKERFLPALFATADSASTISDVGDDMMKRTLPATDLEDEQLVNKLFSLYFGAGQAPRVRPPLRVKILGLLSKSNQSTTFANKIMSLVEDGVAPPDNDGEDTSMSGMSTTNRANIGREATKLRSAVFSYVNFVARHGGEPTLHAIAPRVVSRLRDFIENQGWPRVGGNEDLTSRGYAYEVIGLLAKAGPREVLVEAEGTNFDLLRWLFSSLAQDTSGSAIIVSIEESLSTVLSATARLKLVPFEQSVLEDLLIEQMDLSSDLEANKRIRSTRYVAVRFANRCLPFSSVKARWVDILGIGARGERMELREEAERGLSPYWYRMLNGSSAISGEESITFPTFNAVIEEFFTGRTIDSDAEAMAVAQNANKMRKHCFAHTTAFARRILFNEALHASGNPPNMDHEWERRLDAAAESDDRSRNAIKAHMVFVGEKHLQALAILECALFEGIAADPGAPQDHLVEFLSLSSNKMVQKLLPYVDQLLPPILSNNHNARLAAAHSYAIIATHPAAARSTINSQLSRLIEKAQTWENAAGAQANQVHGSVITLGFYFARSCYRDAAGFKDNDMYTKFSPLLMEMVTTGKDSLLKEACFMALGQLCMLGAFVPDTTEAVKQTIDKVYEVAKTGNEQAILCLGQMSMVLDEGPEDERENSLSYVIEQLHKLHEVKQAEVHFGVGEAFSYVAAGWKSSALAAKLDIEGSPPSGPKREMTLRKLTDRFIADCAQTKPSLKKAAAMWLLCLVQFCGEEKEIQERLGPMQIAFKRCLTDRDELVQETASRGLGLVYEKGDRKLKDDLVRDLVSSFSSDKQTGLAGTVSADTQLFEPGTLPTGDGSVSTYKDIMSLASEVGDSSLVYRFMSMASSNAIWSSRAAFGRFGLSNVLSDSSVDGYLADNPKLYPKLYRYRFDPNQGVQRSMNDIWNALVKDSSATVDRHFDAIIEDLLSSVLGKEWRTRQASCAAIADLVQGRPMEKYEPYLERIWNSCFKVLDDIKESVRVAAASLARTLTGILTRALEADHSSTKTASSMLKHVLPFLLSPSGMESSAQDVQSFAVRTLLEIVKKSNGKTLRPFIPELVERLVGLLSSLEPEAVNYIHLNASKYNLTEQKIDDMRLSSVRSSPIMEAIERCLDLVDDDTMQELQPKLASAMKSAVGLPSKVGSSRILVSLSTRRMAIFKPVADDFMRLIEKLVLDRNETVASSYAAAGGYVARHASDKQILRMVTFAKGLYFDSEHERERRSLTAAELVFGLAKQASDRFNNLASSILPFVFVGKHDSHAAVKEQFQNTWEEAVGGSRAVSLYLKEILDLSNTHLDSPQWTLKHTAARTVADSVMAVSLSEGQISAEAARLLWPSLEKALGGKTWEGKEVVLWAFVKFVQSAKTWFLRDSAVAAAIIKIAVREAKRQNAAYRPHALATLAQVGEARRDVDIYETAMGVVKPLIDDDSGNDPMDVDGDGSKASGVAETRDSTMAAAIEALFASVNPDVAKGDELRGQVAGSLEETRRLRNPSIALQRAVYKGVAGLFQKLAKSGAGEEAAAGDEIAQSLREHLFRADAGSEAVRLQRADAITAVAAFSKSLAAGFRPAMLSMIKDDPSTAVRERLSGAAGVSPS